MMATRKPQILVYVRWSSDQQESGDTLRRQIEGAKEYATKNGWTITKIIKDEGLSAWTGENVSRGNLGKLMKEAETGELPKSIIITEEIDRFCRRGSDALRDILRTFTKSGHEVHFLRPQLIKCTPQNSGLIEDILISVHAYLAKEETDKKAERIRGVCARMRSEAATIPYTSIAPAWLKPIHDKKLKTKKGTPKTISFEVIKERKEIVQQIFKDAANGMGIYTITKRLNESKTPCFGKSKVWNTEYVGDILRNRAVLGEWQPHRKVDGKRKPEGNPIAGYYPPSSPKNSLTPFVGALNNARKLVGGARAKIIIACSLELRVVPTVMQKWGSKAKDGGSIICSATMGDTD